MKDMYSFDTTYEGAIEAYKDVSSAYRAIFAELKVPILVAEASSGDMGGDHSHEYHLTNDIGEDTVAHCKSCGYTANDEVAATRALTDTIKPPTSADEFLVWRGITKDRKTLINAWYPLKNGENKGTNTHALKAAVSDLDTSITDPASAWAEALASHPDAKLVNVLDYRLAPSFDTFKSQLPILPANINHSTPPTTSITVSKDQPIDLLPITANDPCPRCADGTLSIHRALELGHTFYLGTRYSIPLEAYTTLPENPSEPVPLQMGCYGIGVSRILAAVAEHKADGKGLNWPRSIAPYEVIMIPTSTATEELGQLQDSLSETADVVIDDRKKAFGWKMQDADLTGYPVIVVIGKAWKTNKECEVQCRALGIKESVAAADLPEFVRKLLDQL